jgi:hypothetical protein
VPHFDPFQIISPIGFSPTLGIRLSPNALPGPAKLMDMLVVKVFGSGP